MPTLPAGSIVGTTIQGAGDTIVLTFSEAVGAADGTFSGNEFASIESPDGTTLTLTNASFSLSSSRRTLTITLDETTDGAALTSGNTIAVTPTVFGIVDLAGNSVAATEVVGTTPIGGTLQPPFDMVAWWPGDDQPNDIVGANHGTLTGDYANGMVGRGFSLDGVDDFVLVPDASDLDIAGDVTVDLWAMRTTFGAQPFSVMVSKGAVSEQRRELYTVGFMSDDRLFARFTRSTSAVLSLRGPIVTDTNFHLYTYVRSGNTHKLLMDGSVVTGDRFVSGPGGASELPLTIGAIRNRPETTAPDATGFAFHFGGIIDEVELFNRALSDAEIKAIYDAGSAGKAKPPPSVLAPSLPAANIVGTTIQGTGDIITLTFSEAVQAADGTFSSNEFTSIQSPDGTSLALSNAAFVLSSDNKTLTITLDEVSDGAYLVNGNTIAVTPAAATIKDPDGNSLPATKVVGTTANSGDSTAPTVALSYSKDPVQGGDDLTITATFSERMASAPTIAITADSTGDGGTGDLPTTAMTGSGDRKTWTYAFSVPGSEGNNGTAALTIAGTDLAGNTVTPATNNTFTIDNTGNIDSTKPTVTLSYSPDRAVRGGDILTITATFSEVMALAPTIAVTTDSTGDGGTGNLSATAMTDTGNRITWTHTYTAPSGQGNGGTAAVTISGTDLAGNPNTPAINNTFEIDNTRPTVALTYSLNRPVKGGENLTITATFSERMATAPTIAIAFDTTGDGSNNDISATSMVDTGGGVTWTSTFTAPSDAGDSGTAAVTISATDMAGNANLFPHQQHLHHRQHPIAVTPVVFRILDVAGTPYLGLESRGPR